MGHICVCSVCFPCQWESKRIAYSLHRCLSKLLEQGYNITAQIPLTPISVCQKMSKHPSIYSCCIYLFLSPRNVSLGNKLALKGEIYDSLLQVWYWRNIATRALCYQAVMLFVYIAMSYDEVWVVFWKWLTGNHISPHYRSTLDAMSEIVEKINN